MTPSAAYAISALSLLAIAIMMFVALISDSVNF